MFYILLRQQCCWWCMTSLVDGRPVKENDSSSLLVSCRRHPLGALSLLGCHLSFSCCWFRFVNVLFVIVLFQSFTLVHWIHNLISLFIILHSNYFIEKLAVIFHRNAEKKKWTKVSIRYTFKRCFKLALLCIFFFHSHANNTTPLNNSLFHFLSFILLLLLYYF